MQDFENIENKAPNSASAESTSADQAASQPSPNRGRHRARTPEEIEAAAADAAEMDEDILGDEDDIPLRRKKKQPTGRPAGKAGKAQPKKGKKAARKAPPLFSEKKFRRKKSIFEIMSATGEESLIKPIHILGREIRFWPLFILAAIVVLVGVIVMSNGNVSLVSQQVTVVGLPKELENYKVLVLSDLNGKRFGDKQSALVRQVESAGYDIILCMGDMVGKDGDPEPFYELLEGLDSPEDVYFVCGDADPGPYLSSPRQIQGTLEQLVLEDWILGAMERGANYVNAPINLDIGESRIWLTPTSYLNLNSVDYLTEWKDQMRQEEDGVISGLATDYNSLPFTSHRYALAQQFYDAVKKISSSDLVIGLSHVTPDDAFITAAASHSTSAGFMPEPELLVSGHYCGGVWQLPAVGAVYVPSRLLPRNGWFPAQEDVSGLSRISETQVYISAGLSTTSAIPLLPFRAFNDPEIDLLTLTAKLPDNMLEAAK